MFGYNNSTKTPLFLEGDCAKYIDNEDLTNNLSKLNEAFIFISELSTYYKEYLVINTDIFNKLLTDEQVQQIQERKEYLNTDNYYKSVANSYEFKCIINIMSKYNILQPDFLSFISSIKF